ncbi:MAG TPA: hypothetical protein VIF62_33200 [Labilithrix sp.]
MRSIFFVAIALASSVILACSGSDATAPTSEGQSQDGNEPNGSSGSTSSSGGSSSSSGGGSSGGSTSSSSSSSSSGGADAGHDSGTSGGKNDLGAACKADADCTSNVCFVGGSQSYCSLKCNAGNAATVCVPPTFDGSCNKQGYCKKP